MAVARSVAQGGWQRDHEAEGTRLLSESCVGVYTYT
jgi:hypothetical protein